MQGPESAQVYDNILRDIMDVRHHLKQCHATATSEGTRYQVSVPPSSDIGIDIRTLVLRLLSQF